MTHRVHEGVFTVIIEGLDIYAYHGVSAEERAVGHRYHVEIKLRVEGKADVTDDIADTVDYSAVARVAESVLRESQFRTVERLAGAVGDRLLEEYQLISEAEITVRKPMPPMPFVAATAGSTVVRSRS